MERSAVSVVLPWECFSTERSVVEGPAVLTFCCDSPSILKHYFERSLDLAWSAHRTGNQSDPRSVDVISRDSEAWGIRYVEEFRAEQQSDLLRQLKRLRTR